MELNTFPTQRIREVELLEAVISPRFSQGYKRRAIAQKGSNTSTVTLRVVGGDENGSLESETVNGHESHGSRARKCLGWRRPGAIVNDRPVLSSDRVPHINKPATV
jgi:hypothetical protein